MQKMPLKYMLFQSAVPQEFNEWEIRFNYFPLILKKRNIPFADYGSMQYFVENVKYIIYL